MLQVMLVSASCDREAALPCLNSVREDSIRIVWQVDIRAAGGREEEQEAARDGPAGDRAARGGGAAARRAARVAPRRAGGRHRRPAPRPAVRLPVYQYVFATGQVAPHRPCHEIRPVQQPVVHTCLEGGMGCAACKQSSAGVAHMMLVVVAQGVCFCVRFNSLCSSLVFFSIRALFFEQQGCASLWQYSAAMCQGRAMVPQGFTCVA